MSDAGERYVIDWCHAIDATVHLSREGKVVVKSKGPLRNVLGGSEIKRRMEQVSK